MKRGTFKRPQIERKRTVPEAIPVHLRRSAVFARCDVPAAPPVEKDNPIQHEGYARLRPICSVNGCDGLVSAKKLCNKHYLRLKHRGSVEDQRPKPKRTAAQALAEGSRVAESGCIEWIKSTREGYGRLVLRGKSYSAHVLAWTEANGPIPPGLQVNHKCHNRKCINVDHLYLGTQVENMRDMRESGRENRVRGRDVNTAKLDEISVLAIRASEKSAASLAREYGVSESLIRAIRKREVWAWLEDVEPKLQKNKPVRSEEYRRLVASLGCKYCGIAGYSQAAHANTGKGAGIKSDDRTCFPLCADRPGVRGCHSMFDQGALFTKAARRAIEPAWGADTRRQVEAMGLWPESLPKWS